MTNNLSTQLYQTLTHPDTMRSLLAGFFRDSKDQAVALLQKNGVAIRTSAPAKDVHIAFLKALKDSASFRDQAAATLTGYVTKVTGRHGSSNFVGDNAGRYNYYNDVSDIPSLDSSGIYTTDTGSSTPDYSSLYSSGIFSTDTSGGSPAPAPAPTAPAPGNGGSSSGGGFWSSLGSIFTPKVIQAGLTTGLQAYSTGLTASANNTSEANALKIEQTRLAQAQVQAAAAANKGLSTGAIVGIVAGSLVLLTVIIVLVARKK